MFAVLVLSQFQLIRLQRPPPRVFFFVQGYLFYALVFRASHIHVKAITVHFWVTRKSKKKKTRVISRNISFFKLKHVWCACQIHTHALSNSIFKELPEIHLNTVVWSAKTDPQVFFFLNRRRRAKSDRVQLKYGQIVLFFRVQ